MNLSTLILFVKIDAYTVGITDNIIKVFLLLSLTYLFIYIVI